VAPVQPVQPVAPQYGYGQQPQYGYGQQPPQYGYAQPVAPQPTYEPAGITPEEEDDMSGSILTKGILAIIFAWEPILSIIAIVFGSKAGKWYDQLCARAGREIGGRAKVGRILGKIGKIGGIVMTVFWPIYIFIIIVAVLASAATGGGYYYF
ncbi:MAG: hypothetical protein IJF42_08390, partial [Clostridia bacterium]|nr:hypothetical protein [Clostridia bacterium]